jgi:hypothetical protein
MHGTSIKIKKNFVICLESPPEFWIISYIIVLPLISPFGSTVFPICPWNFTEFWSGLAVPLTDVMLPVYVNIVILCWFLIDTDEG